MSTRKHINCDRDFMNISSNQTMVHNNPRPAYSQVSTQSEESLPGDFIIAIGRDVSQATAAIGPVKTADWQGKAVHDRNVGVESDASEDILPEQFLDLPEIGSLSHEGGAMDLLQCRKPIPIVIAEEPENLLILIKTQKLPNDFKRQYLAVTQPGLGSSASQSPSIKSFFNESSTRQYTSIINVLVSIWELLFYLRF